MGRVCDSWSPGQEFEPHVGCRVHFKIKLKISLKIKRRKARTVLGTSTVPEEHLRKPGRCTERVRDATTSHRQGELWTLPALVVPPTSSHWRFLPARSWNVEAAPAVSTEGGTGRSITGVTACRKCTVMRVRSHGVMGCQPYLYLLEVSHLII